MARLLRKEIAGTHILGFSLGGEETVVAAPEYNVCFDVGRAPREIISIDNVCLTHGHMDHAAGVAYYFSQRHFIGNAPGRVIVHRDLAQAIQKLMDVWADIEGHPSPGHVYGVEHLEDVPIRRGLLVRPFDVNHAASSLGFTILEIRRKLKPEHFGKTGPQLVALKRQGVAIENEVQLPILTFVGDSAVGRFLDLDFVQQSKGVVIECTFFEPEHLTRARAGRHVHVNDLPQILAAIPNAAIMLTHLTRRTDLRAARRMLAQAVRREDLDRVTFLMDRPPRPTPNRGTRSPDGRRRLPEPETMDPSASRSDA